MKRTRITATLLVLLVVAAGVPAPAVANGATQDGDCGFPYTVTDARDTQHTIDEEPERIVTLSPSAAQTLWEIGARDKVVGISEYATYLENTDDLEIVNTQAEGIIVEKIVALEPDLVIAPGTINNETVQNLEDKGLTVVSFDSPTSIDGVAQKTTEIGRLTGHCDGATETNDWMQTNVESVRDAVADAESPRAMYVFYGYTVGSDTFIHDAMTSAGLTNVMAEAGISGYAQVNREVVRERDPQWIVVNTGDPGIPDDPAYNETVAVQRNQTVTVDINYMNQPAPRSVVNAVHTMASEVHADEMADVEIQPRADFDVTTTTTTTTTTTEQTTAEPTTTATQTDTDEAATPGFGVGVGVLALLAGLLLARR